MALVWGILIIAVLPHIFVTPEFKESMPQNTLPSKVTARICNWSWVTNFSKKHGLTQHHLLSQW